ncbi:MAG: AbrB/MazE/SpoVT family DNA-binding domain-containing protein [Bosea sp. (in: a-proteobacteria)]
MSAATVTSKGQITIPADVREDFSIEQGHQIVFSRKLNGALGVRVRKPRTGAGRGVVKLDRPLTISDMDAALAETVLEENTVPNLRRTSP